MKIEIGEKKMIVETKIIFENYLVRFYFFLFSKIIFVTVFLPGRVVQVPTSKNRYFSQQTELGDKPYLHLYIRKVK